MFLINSKYGLSKPIAVFMEKLLSYLYAICLLLSYLNLKVAFLSSVTELPQFAHSSLQHKALLLPVAFFKFWV